MWEVTPLVLVALIVGPPIAGWILLVRLAQARARQPSGAVLYRARGCAASLRTGSGLVGTRYRDLVVEILVCEDHAVLIAPLMLPIPLRRPGPGADGIVLTSPGRRRDDQVILEGRDFLVRLTAPEPWRLIEALETYLCHDPDAPPYR